MTGLIPHNLIVFLTGQQFFESHIRNSRYDLTSLSVNLLGLISNKLKPFLTPYIIIDTPLFRSYIAGSGEIQILKRQKVCIIFVIV